MKVGALFAGYGGIELAVSSVWPAAELAWVCETGKAPSRILAHHWPDATNHGDVTAVDWASVEQVDIITGGSPCQDLSTAGRRKGMTDGTRSNLWAEMREAIAVIRPRLVVWENVRGALSAPASSDVEREPGLLGVRRDGPALRALGRVVGDLASLGYVGRWYGLRAADVGAAHGRFRVFVIAELADTKGDPWWLRDGDGRGATATRLEGLTDLTLLPTPLTSDANGAGAHGTGGINLRTAVTLLPTPVADNSRGLPSASTDYASLANVAVSLLPTPRATDGTKGGPNQRGSSGDLMLPSAVLRNWGSYGPAIARWETVIGRPAPVPIEPGPKGNPRLSPAFVEWLMGLPEGWVTDVPDISRSAALTALGNGVVPQQAAAALRAYINSQAQSGPGQTKGNPS